MIDVKAAAETWCVSYLDAFNAKDVPAIAKHWAFPALIVTGQRSFAYTGAEPFERNTSRLLEFYADQNVAHAQRRCLKTLPLGATEMAIYTEDTFLDGKGEILAGWQSGYVLQLRGDGWRAVLASADGEALAWRARGTPLPGT